MEVILSPIRPGRGRRGLLEWECSSLKMHILTENGDVPDREYVWFIQGVMACTAQSNSAQKRCDWFENALEVPRNHMVPSQ